MKDRGEEEIMSELAGSRAEIRPAACLLFFYLGVCYKERILHMHYN